MNIAALRARGRGPMLDFVPEPDSTALAELIVAFCNGVGGAIIVGLDEQGAVHPDAATFLEPALERALRTIVPSLRSADLPECFTEETPEGLVATINVRPTPYQVSVEGREVLVRSGNQNVRLSLEQAAQDRRGRQGPSFEDEVVPGATPADFDQEVLAEYQRNRIQRGPRGEVFSQQELLRDAGAIDPQGRPTAAGLLLFGAAPQRFISQAGVVVVRFRGTSVRQAALSAERYARRVEIVGPAARVVEQTWQVLFDEIRHQPLVSGLARREVYDYPPEAVREAMVNAICHRDYDIAGQRIEIRLFDDRLEIMSPGGLPGHITPDNMRDEHYSRNPRLVRGLYYWGYIEELGQGVDIIYEAMQRDHHPAPVFSATPRSLTVTLHNAVDQIELQYGEELNPRQVRALQFLAAHERITNRDYQELCPDVTPETLRLDLRDLVGKGILLKIGSKRGTCYVKKSERMDRG